MAEAVSFAGAQVTKKELCETCEIEKEAKWFCVDCSEKLCDRCKTSHLKSKKTKNDEVVSLHAVDQQLDRARMAVIMCREHNTQVCQFYCDRCEHVICAECLAQHHKSHEWKLAEKFLPIIVSNIAALKVQLEIHVHEQDKNVSLTKDAYSQFDEGIKDTEIQIKNEMQKISDELEKVQEDYFLELSELQENEDKAYSEMHEKYDHHLAKARKLLELCQEEAVVGNINNLLKLKKNIKEMFSTLSMPLVYKVTNPVFRPADREPSQLGHVFGELDTSGQQETNLSKSVVTQSIEGIQRSMSTENDVQLDSNETNQYQRQIQVTDPEGKKTYKAKYVKMICPDQNGGAWLVLAKDRVLWGSQDNFLTHVDQDGKVTHQTGKHDSEIVDFSVNSKGQRFVVSDHKIEKTSANEKDTIVFDFNVKTCRSIALSTNDDMLVGVLNGEYTKRFKWIVLRIHHASNRVERKFIIESNFLSLISLTSLSTEDIVAVLQIDSDVGIKDCVVNLYNDKGELQHTWNHDTWNTKKSSFRPKAIVHDNNDMLYITDETKPLLYTIDKDGSNPRSLQTNKLGVEGKPQSIALDKSGRIWLGSSNGRIYIFEEICEVI